MDQIELRKICKKVKIISKFQYNVNKLYQLKYYYLKKKCKYILDIGKGSRKWYSIFEKNQILTLDINKYKDYPDIIDDICSLRTINDRKFDAVICNAVLEHTYSPELAIENIYNILKNEGIFFGFIPFIWRYHAPKNLYYQDYYRFTKDGIAYLFRNFKEITLYSVRGKYSSMLNLIAWWKIIIEKFFTEKINYIVDWLFKNKNETKQVSGYVVWAIK
ncbi:MAG: class I SAM-dependent methyltransferase [Candidatus Helarchaeota archaeon]